MLISSPEEKYEAKLIAELGEELQPMSTPGMAVFTLRLENGCFCKFALDFFFWHKFMPFLKFVLRVLLFSKRNTFDIAGFTFSH